MTRQIPHESTAVEVRLWLCSACGGYTPLTGKDYEGYLSGTCDRCGDRVAEVHLFGLLVPLDTLGPCECDRPHPRRETC